MITLSIPMKINSIKKHSVRYDAVDLNAAIQSVYLLNKDIPDKNNPPQTIVVKGRNSNMKTEIIAASYLMQFQKQLRLKKGTLIRAIPFTKDNTECYRMMYVENV